MRIACVVEGHGEVDSVPILVRRLAEACDPPAYPDVQRPIRIPGSKLRKPDEMRRAAQLAASRAGEGGAVLVLLDAEDDCPKERALTLAAVIGERTDVKISVVLPKYE